MSEKPPDFGQLARRYLDLWQEQVAHMANDPVLAQVAARGIALMAEAPAAFVQAAANSSEAAHGQFSYDGTTLGTSPAAAAPDGARGDDDGLAARIAALEGRVAALEAELGRRGGELEEKPGRNRRRRLDKA